jgi:hypothetical protein
LTGAYQGGYTAIGANGQYFTVLPAMGLVVAYKVDFDEDGHRQVTPSEFQTILQMVIESELLRTVKGVIDRESSCDLSDR